MLLGLELALSRIDEVILNMGFIYFLVALIPISLSVLSNDDTSNTPIALICSKAAKINDLTLQVVRNSLSNWC